MGGGRRPVGFPFISGARCGWHFWIWEEKDGESERELSTRALDHGAFWCIDRGSDDVFEVGLGTDAGFAYISLRIGKLWNNGVVPASPTTLVHLPTDSLSSLD